MLLRTLLRLLGHSNLPLSIGVLEYESLLVEPSQNVGRSLEFDNFVSLFDDLLLEKINASAELLFLFLLQDLLEFELFHLSLGALAFGASFQHVDTSSVHSYTYKQTS